jgi:hypothetical protein
MILQRAIPYDPLSPPPLPGIAPLDPGDWLRVDEAFAGQMGEKDRLVRDRRAAVIALDDGARAAAGELLDEVVAAQMIKPGFARDGDVITRPDGGRVPVRWSDPMGTLARLAQEDFCILEKRGDEHVMTAAALCFPASWSLDEKFMRPLVGIHLPVDSYDEGIARRVQRLFDGVQAGRPLWRFNALWYADADLHQPRREGARRPRPAPGEAPFMRSELQTIRRLPESGAVVFGIHTYVLAERDVPGRAQGVPPEP